MEGWKGWYASRTHWALIVMMLSNIATAFLGKDFGLTPEQQVQIVTGLTTVGGLVAAYFRSKATKQIGAPK